MIYSSSERPPWPKLLIYSFQMVAMSTYSIIWGVALVGLGINLSGAPLATFITATVFTIGLAIIAQAWLGHRMGLLAGPNIVPGFTMITAYQAGFPLNEIFGGFVIGAFLVILLGLLGVANYVQRFFTPLVTGSLIMMIGLGSASLGVSFLAELGLPFLVFAILLGLGVGYISFTLSGFISTIAVLIIVIVGYLGAIAAGFMDWSLVTSAPLVTPPHPFFLGIAWPRPGLLIAAVIAILVSGVQELTYVIALTEVAQEPFDLRRIRPIISVFGFAESIFPSLLSATPVVTYSVNAGFMAATGVASRYPTIVAGVILMILSMLGPVAGFLAAMPKPIAGAILLGLAGPSIGIGARLWRAGTPQFSDTNAFIVGFSVFLALGWQALPSDLVAQLPAAVSQILGNPVVAVLIYIILLEQLVFRTRPGRR